MNLSPTALRFVGRIPARKFPAPSGKTSSDRRQIMDHFGIGQAMKGMARCYFLASRGTGRTTSLLESLKDGDRVCCATGKEADRLTRMLRERKVDAQAIAVDP